MCANKYQTQTLLATKRYIWPIAHEQLKKTFYDRVINYTLENICTQKIPPRANWKIKYTRDDFLLQEDDLY